MDIDKIIKQKNSPIGDIVSKIISFVGTKMIMAGMIMWLWNLLLPTEQLTYWRTFGFLILIAWIYNTTKYKHK